MFFFVEKMIMTMEWKSLVLGMFYFKHIYISSKHFNRTINHHGRAIMVKEQGSTMNHRTNSNNWLNGFFNNGFSK